MLGQIASIIGMALTIVSFQMKTRKQIILLQTAGSVFFLLSYLLLESWSAVYLNVVFFDQEHCVLFQQRQKVGTAQGLARPFVVCGGCRRIDWFPFLAGFAAHHRFDVRHGGYVYEK